MINAFNCIHKWFRIILVSLNVNKTYCMQFRTKNKPINDINISCNNYLITTQPNIGFLGIHISDTINWSCHIESIIPTLCSACYIMRGIKSYMPLTTLKTFYYSYFNMVMSYGLYPWGNSPHSLKIFRMQKIIIRIMIGCNSRVSCRNLFRKLEILLLASQYILSPMIFVVKNKKRFILNSGNHNINTTQSRNFYQPLPNLTVYQKGVYCMGIRVYNNLLFHIKEDSYNLSKFKRCLKYNLQTHYFYSIEEYFQYRAGTS
jgi:hypothetical protein